MEPYEIAAFLGAVEVVLEHARPGHAVTVQQAGGDGRSALHIRWPVVELVIERDTNIGRASFAGPQRLAVALTTMKWVDGQLTHVARRAPLPPPHTQLCIRYAYDMRAYAMLAAGEVPALYSYAELCRQLLVDIVRPWAHTSLLARTGAPPAAEDLLADMPWNVLAEAVDDFRRAAHECATLHDLAPDTGWARLSAPAKRVAWFAKGAGAGRVALLLSGRPAVGGPLLRLRGGGGRAALVRARRAPVCARRRGPAVGVRADGRAWPAARPRGECRRRLAAPPPARVRPPRAVRERRTPRAEPHQRPREQQQRRRDARADDRGGRHRQHVQQAGPQHHGRRGVHGARQPVVGRADPAERVVGRGQY